MIMRKQNMLKDATKNTDFSKEGRVLVGEFTNVEALIGIQTGVK